MWKMIFHLVIIKTNNVYKKELPRNGQTFWKNVESYKDHYQQLAKAQCKFNFFIKTVTQVLKTAQSNTSP